MGEAGARWRTGDADEMLAGRALDLPSGMARIALQRLVTMGTIKFEFVGTHGRFVHPEATAGKKHAKNLFSLLDDLILS